MQSGKYKVKHLDRSFGRRKKGSFKLYYGISLIIGGILVLLISLIYKL